MTTNITELQRQNDLADALVVKLERIKALRAELPTEDDLVGLEKIAASIAYNLNAAAETFKADDFPNADADALCDLDKIVDSIASNLIAAAETFNADDFPCSDDLDDLDKKVDGIASSFNEIIEQQAEVA